MPNQEHRKSSVQTAAPAILSDGLQDAGSSVGLDDNAFFYEATRLLCSSLVPEEAIRAFFDYLASFVPLKRFSLSTAPASVSEVMRVAAADAETVECPFCRDYLTPEHSKVAAALDVSNPTKYRECLMTSTDDEFFRYLSMFGFEKLTPLPIFFLRLVREDKLVGAAQFQSDTAFSEHHLRLMRGLEGPLCIALANMLQHHALQRRSEEILQDNQRLRRELQGLGDVDVIGGEHGLAHVMVKVRQAAPVDIPLLITGETGTGKEVIARAAHRLSSRAQKPFVAINCGALPPSLIESELFGHVRGAFTNATSDRKGYFERADNGTLFLDEIGELPLSSQARLLRVLETGEVERVGASASLRLNIRLVAATNRDLKSMIAQGEFRADLYYRLKVVSIHLPPLRERRQDIPLLVQHLLRNSAARLGMVVPDISPGEMEKLMTRLWPGNVRELQNVLEEALVCSGAGPLRIGPAPIAPAAPEPSPDPALVLEGELTFDDVARLYLEFVLRSTQWRVAGKRGAAAKAGLGVSTFRFRCQKLGVELRPNA